MESVCSNICPVSPEQLQPKFLNFFFFCCFSGKGVPFGRADIRFIFSFSRFSFLFLCSVSPDSREETVLGSIPLPSYVISPVEPEDHISRKFAFKVSPSFSSVRDISHIPGSQGEFILCHEVRLGSTPDQLVEISSISSSYFTYRFRFVSFSCKNKRHGLR